MFDDNFGKNNLESLPVYLGYVPDDGLINQLSEAKGIPAANQDFSLEVHFSGREDSQNSKKSGDEALAKISISGDL